MSLNGIKLISGKSNLQLADKIAKHLGITLVNCCLDKFGNTEIKVEINESIRNSDVYIVETGGFDDKYSINDYLMELLSIVYACKLSSAKSITAVTPYYPYSRSDKKDAPRVPINAALVANLLKEAGVNRIVAMDLHSGQIQSVINQPFDNLYAIKLHVSKLHELYFKDMTTEDINKKYVLVAPDVGAVKRINSYAKLLHMKFLVMNKQRDYSKSNTVIKSDLIGDTSDLEGKTAIIVDDIVDTLGTMTSACNELQSYGISKVVIVATHGIFSGPAIERLNNADVIERVIVTDTICQNNNLTRTDKISVVDTSELFAEVLKRLQMGGSVSELFH